MISLPRPFTPGQRRALVGLVALFLIFASIGLLRNPAHVPDPLPAAGPREGELVVRLDPNDATARQLSALPGLGERRAGDLVAYRDQQRAAGRIAFRTLNDLLKVDGIGPAIARQIEPHLQFPTPPASRSTGDGRSQ